MHSKWFRSSFFGNTSEVLLDYCATPNLFSQRLAVLLAVTVEKVPKRVVNGNRMLCVFLGVARQVPISFDGKIIRMIFPILQSPPFDIIIWRLEFEEMQGCSEFDSQSVTLHIAKRFVKPLFEHAKMKLPVIQKSESYSMNIDSDNFTLVSSAKKQGLDEEYFFSFEGDVLEEAQRKESPREEERSFSLASETSHLGVGCHKTIVNIYWCRKSLSHLQKR